MTKLISIESGCSLKSLINKSCIIPIWKIGQRLKYQPVHRQDGYSLCQAASISSLLPYENQLQISSK